MTTKTVDLTPMWAEVLPAMLAVIANPKAEQSAKTVMYEELGRMAKAADRYLAYVKAND